VERAIARELTTPRSVPNAALIERRLLGSLLVSIVADLAKRLQVAWIPEQSLITTMRSLVVTDQQRGVAPRTSALSARTASAFITKTR
jgi:hypothetical protein